MSYPLPPKPEKKQKPKKTLRGKILSVVFWLTVILCLGGFMLFVVLSGVSGQGDRQKNIVESIFANFTGGSVRIETLNFFSLAPDLIYNFDKLETSGGNVSLKIGHLNFHSTFWSLITADPMIKEIDIKNIELRDLPFLKKELLFKAVSVKTSQESASVLVFKGGFGGRKLTAEIGLDAHQDAFGKKYYTFPNNIPLHLVIDDLDIQTVFKRGVKPALDPFVAHRINKPADQVTGNVLWQQEQGQFKINIQAQSKRSSFSFSAPFSGQPADEASNDKAILEASKIDWDDFLGSSTLSALRKLVADIRLQPDLKVDFQIAPDLVFTCKPEASGRPSEKALHEKVLQYCFD